MFTWPATRKLLDDGNYKIVMAWSIANMCELIGRNKNRTMEDMIQFINKPNTNSAPRLPDIRFDKYRSAAKNIETAFNKFIELCAEEAGWDKDFCYRRGIQFIVFNNTDKRDPNKSISDYVIYDSENIGKRTRSQSKKFNDVFNTNCLAPGSHVATEETKGGRKHYRKSRRKRRYKSRRKTRSHKKKTKKRRRRRRKSKRK